MPKNKSYDDRKKILNEAFRSIRTYTLQELIDRVSERLGDSISKKTIQNDIRAIKQEALEKDAELKCVNSRYFYEPRNFNLYEVKIDPASVEKIKLAATILKQVPGLDIHEELKEVFERLNMRTGDIEDGPDIIQFDTRPGYTGAKHLSEILEAIKGETVINFKYQPFIHSKAMEITLHPYLLKEYNNRWFLIGLPEHLRIKQQYEFHVYGLERIKTSIKPVNNIIFYRHPNFNPSTYFKHVIGVTIPNNGKVETVIVRFRIPRAYYIETNPLHTTQTLIGEDFVSKTFEYQVIINPEFQTLINSFGKDAESSIVNTDL